MPSINKPLIPLAAMPKNEIGLTIRDYEGSMSTLCAGCGHDSVTAAIVRALFELSVPPHKVVKMSGIGCSSKTTAYFDSAAHGFNSAHGRMAPIATGANAANRDALYVGISGDGDSLSIGAGHMVHAIRRNVHMIYVIENNGVYGLTKGQFSASADIGSAAKHGEANTVAPVDPVMLALSLGASFVARSFSGDKEQLVPILKAAAQHRGLALIDVISPCVQFNNHYGSTKSYRYVREHELREIDPDFIDTGREIVADLPRDGALMVAMHDGGLVRFRTLPAEYDPTDREAAMHYVNQAHARGEIPTGLLFVDESIPDVHELNHTSETPLVELPFDELCPGSAELEEFQQSFV